MTFHNPDYIRAMVADRERTIRKGLVIVDIEREHDDEEPAEPRRWARRRRTLLRVRLQPEADC